MALPWSAAVDKGRFGVAAATWAGLVLLFAVLLQPFLPSGVREGASSLGLLVAGVVATTCGLWRSRVEKGSRGRPWLLLSSAGVVVIAGNVWVAVTGADPITSPSLVGDLSIAVGLVISTLGLLAFPSARRRGAELVVMFLDGLVAGGALLLIASVLVYSRLLDSPRRGDAATQVLALVFPVLDVVLATVAVLLVVRATRADRLMLGLVGSGFLLYAASDLAFAVRTAQGTFEFGSVLDLGWIAGYLTLGLATWVPMRRERDAAGQVAGGLPVGLSDAVGTTLVFGIVVVAAVVQVVFGQQGALQGPQSVLWVILIAAAGARQVLLTRDNASLRRGLEKRVLEQTADLRRLARQNEVLVTSVGDGVYGVDHDGRVTFVNPSGAAALGYSTSDLEGVSAHERFHAPREDGTPYPWSGCYISEAVVHGALSSGEEDVYVRADGSSFPVEITASPLMDDEEVRGAVVVFRDVTQRREVDRMKDEFLAVVSHELRTPLTSIQGSLGLLSGGRMGELPERAGSLVAVALQSTERLTRLINDLLDIERMDSGIRPLNVTSLEAADLLRAASRQIDGLAASAGVRVEVVAAEGRVLADEDSVMQTLMNLLGNAIKFSSADSSVRLDAQSRGGQVHFRVSDDGRGIPMGKLESIFERFAQVDSSDTRQQGGTGLGLTICRSIVERHGGRIWVESEAGVGTVVHFTLPQARPLGGETVTAPAGAPIVLVCDDDANVVQSFATLLSAHGYRAIGVTDGARAVELAVSEQPQAVLLDLLMPGTTGAQVLDELRSNATTQNIPVVVISGLGPEAAESVARSTEGWLVKPVSEERLVHTVAIALSGRTPGATVLLVEDDKELAEVITAMLADEGLDVVNASSATQAVVTGHEMRPDIIVLDLSLPDGDGSDVVAEFRRRGALAQTPLIVYSASDVADERHGELQLGTTVFLTKGRTSPEELRDQVLGMVEAVTTQGDRSPREGTTYGTSTT